MSASILIPAHNEESVLARTLDALLGSNDSPEFEVLVVCNGCKDRSAQVARRYVPRLRVAELPVASKTAALNLGDQECGGYPRIYLDADVTLSEVSALALIGALESGAMAAEPKRVFEIQASSPFVRAYYTVWNALHGAEPGDLGCGVLAMSREGRARFGEFPDVISDDGFARAHFAPGEIVVVEQAQVAVLAPRTIRALIAIKTRSRLGVLELQARFPKLWKEKRASTLSVRRKLLAMPLRYWPMLPLYTLIQLFVRRRARARFADLSSYQWERDESSR